MPDRQTAWISSRQRAARALVLALLCLLAVGAVPLIASETPEGSELRGAVDQGAGEWTVGDRIGFTLVLVHPPGLVPALPEVESRLGHFQVSDFKDGGNRTLDDGRREQTWRYRLTAFETGDLEIPAVSVALTGGDEGMITVTSAPVTVQLVSVIEGEVEDIADLRPPAEVPYSFVPLVLWCLAGLAALVLLLWFLAWRRVRRGRKALRDEASLFSPRELAIRELQRLTASDLLKHDRSKAFYVAISGLIGRLLHGALGVVTAERTSWEILHDLRRQATGSPLVPAAGAFFEACDRVKFSRHLPGDAENSSVIAAAYQLVDLAAPEPVAPDQGEGG